jgi:hypothetical protein
VPLLTQSKKGSENCYDPANLRPNSDNPFVTQPNEGCGTGKAVLTVMVAHANHDRVVVQLLRVVRHFEHGQGPQDTTWLPKLHSCLLQHPPGYEGFDSIH